MSYDSQEKSAAAGSPVEAYEFTISGGVFRYTTQTSAVTLGGFTYQPLEMKRSRIEMSQERSGSQLTIDLPTDADIALRYLGKAPSARMGLTIRRAHRTDGATPQVATFWKGYVVNVKFSDLKAKMVCEPLGAFLGSEMPRRTYQYLCNFMLFDSDCALLKSPFSNNVVVGSVSSGGLVLVLNSLSAARPLDSTFFLGGVVERTNGDKRKILEYTFATNTVRLTASFDGLLVGETVVARAGCPRDLDTCISRFNNKDNYGGFPHGPNRNPFETGA